MTDHDNRRGPDFVCIGAQKAGTTWLYDRLSEQPRYWLPPVKEIHYFNRVCPNESLLGVETLPGGLWKPGLRRSLRRPVETLRWLRRFYGGKPSNRWYEALFAPRSARDRTRGDMTPAYSTLDARGVELARNVLRPGCKVFLIVRSPIERAWSGLKMMYRWRETPIDAAKIDTILEELEHPTHRLRGDYLSMIRLWGDAFGEDFRVLQYDDLRASPGEFLESVAAYIGTPVEVERSRLGERSNYDPRSLTMPEELRARLIDRYGPEIRALDALVPGIEARWTAD